MNPDFNRTDRNLHGRGEHRPRIGEFACQNRFIDRKGLGREAMPQVEAFLVPLHDAAVDFPALKATKMVTVNKLLGNPPRSHA